MVSGSMPAVAAPLARWLSDAHLHVCEAPPQAPAIIAIADPQRLRDSEFEAVAHAVNVHGWAHYRTRSDTGREALAELAASLGLGPADRTLTGPEDGLVELTPRDTGAPSHYVPYSRKPLGWHTDGYYNPPARTIRAFILHCVNPAADGGENRLIDPRRVLARVARAQAVLALELAAPDFMTIPANEVEGRILRPEAQAPVFACDDDGALTMRYTARPTHIRWRSGETAAQALECLREAIETEAKLAATLKLGRGEGIVCNNVLHCRSGFGARGESRANARRLLRGRYLRRVATPHPIQHPAGPAVEEPHAATE